MLPKSQRPSCPRRRRWVVALALAFVLGAAFGPPAPAQQAQNDKPPEDAIIISGASGALAGETIQALVQRGIKLNQLILVTRTPGNLASLAENGAQVRSGDFTKPETLEAAFAGGREMLLISTNSEGDRVAQHSAAISAARRAGVRRIVYTSFTNPTDENPASIVRDHRLTEEALTRSGVAYTILRNQLYMEGMVDELARAVARGEMLTNAGRGKWAPVSRRDCGAVAAVVLTTTGHERKIYDITGPDLVNWVDLAKLVSEVAGRSFRVIQVDDRVAIERGVQEGLPEAVAKRNASFGLAMRANALNIRSDVLQILLRRPPLSVREMLAQNKARLAPANRPANGPANRR
jgi:NAD(P)H dehydrogenase (quinone)